MTSQALQSAAADGDTPATPYQLKADLPDHLYWLTERIQSLVKPAARMFQVDGAVARVGGTFTCGVPDVPIDAPWASGMSDESIRRQWMCSPCDGDSFWLQLNLEDIPEAVRKPEWPRAGMVWMFLDASASIRGYKVIVHHDPRPASQIQFRDRVQFVNGQAVSQPKAVRFELVDTLPVATEQTLPEIADDWRSGGMVDDYEQWLQKHYGGMRGSEVATVGGWCHPIQGDYDEANETAVLSMEDQGFGDSGAVYLHYSAERGFFGMAWTH